MPSLSDIELADIHKFCTNNRPQIDRGGLCGCFFCEEVFDPEKMSIREWTDRGQTALCPICGIDSVVSSRDEPRIVNAGVLHQLYVRWFDLENL
jgi:hypothetical protein